MKGFKKFSSGGQMGHSFPKQFGFSGSSGSGSRKYAEGGAVEPNSILPDGPKQDAPHGKVNFADFKRGGKACMSRGGKSKK